MGQIGSEAQDHSPQHSKPGGQITHQDTGMYLTDQALPEQLAHLKTMTDEYHSLLIRAEFLLSGPACMRIDSDCQDYLH